MKITYDASVDEMYIYFIEQPHHQTRILDGGLIVDFAGDGKVIGIEILQASRFVSNPDEIIYQISSKTHYVSTFMISAKPGQKFT